MVILVIGGSGSGKSERAESLVLELGEKRIYLATMIASGEEGKQRVDRHKKLREGKGLSWENLERICSLLDCQPADLIEYVKDTE